MGITKVERIDIEFFFDQLHKDRHDRGLSQQTSTEWQRLYRLLQSIPTQEQKELVQQIKILIEGKVQQTITTDPQSSAPSWPQTSTRQKM
ncbi:MAG: hypothetical protein OXT67_08340 [Zetaproteobacteria bacterium]|nr:hypothetical protein [Zetaproteobacteria bacterium]